MTSERRLQLKRKAQGKCIRCGDPTPVGVHCQPCRDYISNHRLAVLTLRRIPYLVENGILERRDILRVLPRSHHISDPQY